MIDNHAHWVKAAEHDEVRFDGVTSRARALKLVADRAASTPAGEWIAVLGGWSEEQFTDDQSRFTGAELDAIAPNNPVALQSVYDHTVLNSAGLKAANIDATTADPPGGKIERDANNPPSGLVSGGGGVAFVAAKIPPYWLILPAAVTNFLFQHAIQGWFPPVLSRQSAATTTT